MEVLETKASQSKTTQWWVENLVKPIFIMMLFVRAEREVDWPLHLWAVKEMIPYFFAAGHCNYARYATYYLHSMEKLSKKVFDASWKGNMWCGINLVSQSSVPPVPTRHRRHACIKMRTALPANTKTWPNVVSMLVQRRWRWANIETALGQILAFAGLHTGVCLHPSRPYHNILASRSGYF